MSMTVSLSYSCASHTSTLDSKLEVSLQLYVLLLDLAVILRQRLHLRLSEVNEVGNVGTGGREVWGRWQADSK